ncbi:MAG TPA: hypothetical protein VFR17_03410 [Mycobacterium sp.]|nr:hypothetical protein [Mycobacterium sp.]
MKIVVAMATGITAMVATLTMLGAPGQAGADPAAPDPNLPNMAANYCPGGREDGPFVRRCIGTKYPDGSYWRESQYSVANYSPDYLGGPGLRCVIDYGPMRYGSATVAAPPGGCNGAV